MKAILLFLLQVPFISAQDMPDNLLVALSKLKYAYADSDLTRHFLDPQYYREYRSFFKIKEIGLDDSASKTFFFKQPLWENQYGPCCGDTNMSSDNPNRVKGYLYPSIAIWTWLNTVNSFLLLDDKYMLESGISVGMPISILETKFPGLSLVNKRKGHLEVWCGYSSRYYYTEGIIRYIYVLTGSP